MDKISFSKFKERMIKTAAVTKTPICCTFELTPRCNLDCKMCYVHNKESNSLKEMELPTNTWKSVFDEAYNSGMLFATLTGGECLLRSDFRELYLHLWNKRVYITVFTNGILLDEEYVSFFKKYKPQKIQISLYGSSEDGYLNVTGHRGFERVVSTIRSLMDAGILVQIAVTPSSYMKEDYLEILRFCKNNGFYYKNGELLLIKSRDDSQNTGSYMSTDEIVQLSTERARLSGTLMPNKDELPPCGGGCTEPPKGLNCGAGKTYAVVSWDGSMRPCVSIPISKASVLEISYEQAWEKTKEVAQEIMLGAECVGCPYDKVCPKCPALRLTGLDTGHCNPNVCEMTRKLVAAGVKKLPDTE